MASYARSREQHCVRDKDVDGIVVVLEDRSMWEVHPSDRWMTARWLRMSTIIVECTEKEGYPYLLNNATEEESTRANYLGDLAQIAE